MLPALASVADIEARRPSDVDGFESTRVQAVLEDVSALVRAEAGKTWVAGITLDSDLPDVVVAITIKATLRTLLNPDGVSAETIGAATTSYESADDVFLTEAECRMIRKVAGVAGLWVLPTTRGLLETSLPCDDVTYLPVDPAGEPIPWDAGV